MKQMKQLFNLLGLFFSLLLSASTYAYDFEVEGIYYNIISQSNLEVEVTYSDYGIKGSGTGSEFSLYRYQNNTPYLGVISIPSSVSYNNRNYTVVSIGDFAFGAEYFYYEGNRPFGITYLGKYYYGYWQTDGSTGCDLTKIKLPNTITHIGKYAFACCKNLTEIEWSDSVLEIEKGAFENCIKITSIVLPDRLTSISSNSFSKTNISKVIIPNSVETICSEAFASCPSLSQIVLSSHLNKIEDNSFNKCPKLLEVYYTNPEVPNGKVYPTNSNMESYVPSSKIYGFGRDYISFNNDSFEYTGLTHLVEGTNNIKYLTCKIEQPIETEINAGDYTKYIKVNYSGDVELSLNIPYSYTIIPAPLVVTVSNAEREYGEPNPLFTCTATGFVPGENLSTIGVTPKYECEATQLSNAGTYKILVELDAKNYNVTYNYGTLTVTKAPITATVINSTKNYGDANPSFELAYTGLKNNGVTPSWIAKPVFTTLADSKTSVGEYEVTADGGESLNYIVTRYSPGVLSILKRDLKVKANNAEKLYGEENPVFQVTFSGFVNSDSQNVLLTQPEAYCNATAESNAGEYPILVEGGSAENYSMVYERGTLYIKPLTVGFKNIYNTVTFDDMSVSSNERYFNYLPEIEGPFSEDDFYIELWFIDGDNKYSNHVYTETSGSYEGNYVNTNYERPMQAGKYIFNLTSKGNTPNVVANPSRCYLTVETNSTNLAWNDSSPIIVKVGETVELDISYLAYIYCQFNVYYDEDIITLTAINQTSNSSQWFVTGLKEGETTVSLAISCLKNDMGFYDFYDSKTVSKKIKVLLADPNIDAVEEIDPEKISIRVFNNIIYTEKPEEIITYVYDLNGNLIIETSNSQIDNLQRGIYIIRVGNQVKKIII